MAFTRSSWWTFIAALEWPFSGFASFRLLQLDGCLEQKGIVNEQTRLEFKITSFNMFFCFYQILWLCWADDWTQTQQILVSLLEIFCSRSYVRSFHILHLLLRTSKARSWLHLSKVGRDSGTFYVIFLNDLGSWLRRLLYPYSTWHNHGGLFVE